jgi:hypothetical protein
MSVYALADVSIDMIAFIVRQGKVEFIVSGPWYGIATGNR